MRKKILKIYGWIFAVCIPYLIWFCLTGIGIPCMMYNTTGLLCSGCGITRMFHALLRLEFAEAFKYNSAAFVLIIVWNVIALFAFLGKPYWVRSCTFLYTGLSLTVIILILFAIIRNIT